MAIKTASELVAKCKEVAQNYKTLYVMGCFGAPMTESNKERYSRNHSYNRQTVRTVMIKSATADTFGFDCCGLIKGVLWGWNGNKSKTYGGASYATNGVPDISADQLITKCKDVSTDFSKITVGELLWMSGHVGIYIGNGQAVECTPSWKNGVQITNVQNIKAGTGRKWTKHGKLPYVTYETETANTPKEDTPPEPAVKPSEPVSKPTGTNTTATEVRAKDGAKSFLSTLAGTYKVTASALNVRHGAGTSKKVMTTIPKGTAVKCYGYYTQWMGANWLCIQFVKSGVKYTGFASAKYLKK